MGAAVRVEGPAGSRQVVGDPNALQELFYGYPHFLVVVDELGGVAFDAVHIGRGNRPVRAQPVQRQEGGAPRA